MNTEEAERVIDHMFYPVSENQRIRQLFLNAFLSPELLCKCFLRAFI